MKKSVIVWLLAMGMVFCLTGCGTYEVRYDPNGGTKVSGELLQQVKHGQSATPPIVEREGYYLVGWDHEASNVTGNMVIAAEWEKGIKIEFDANGGEVTSGKAVQYIAPGATPEIPSVTRENLEFLGWSPEVGAADKDTVYQAQWPKQPMDGNTLYKQVSPSVVEITVYDDDNESTGLGTGFFIDDRGTVLTNYHVMEAAYSAKVTLGNEKKYQVTAVLDYNPDLDLALLETDASGNEFVSIAEGKPETGDKVYAIGSSRGLTGSLSEGIVSVADQVSEDVHYIQHTAPISPGNSGGPLLNEYGEVVGVNSMSLKDSQNINFAIRIDQMSQLDPNKRMLMPDFGRGTDPEVRLDTARRRFVSNAASIEQEGNNNWLAADELTLGAWTAGIISDTSDVDCFYVSVNSPRRITFEVVPFLKSDAEELIGVAAAYDGEGDADILGSLENSSSYSADVEKVYVLDAPQAGIYFVAITHDDDYSFSDIGYVYLVKAS
ncbi:MAG: trypsin-like peptidase domain-containing protein [Oscillibacter sp.]|nr:trypsin-like peptidase domain-containing protein [Oscillibacter sp.]